MDAYEIQDLYREARQTFFKNIALGNKASPTQDTHLKKLMENFSFLLNISSHLFKDDKRRYKPFATINIRSKKRALYGKVVQI